MIGKDVKSWKAPKTTVSQKVIAFLCRTPDTLCAINELDEEIRKKSNLLLSRRNRWLKSKGWVITCEIIGPTKSYFYQKYGELFICEHDAIDRETHGT